MSSILNEIIPSSGTNLSYVQDIQKDFLFETLLNTRELSYVYDPSGNLIKDQKAWVIDVISDDSPGTGGQNTLVLSFARDWTSERIIVDDEVVDAFTFTDYLSESYDPFPVSGDPLSSTYGYFPLEAGTYHLNFFGKISDIYPVNEGAETWACLEAFDSSNLNISTNTKRKITIDQKVLPLVRENMWKWVDVTFTVDKYYPKCLLSFNPTNCVLFINGIVLSRDGTNAFYYNSPRRTIGQALFENPENAEIKVYYRERRPDVVTPPAFAEIDQGDIGFDTLSITQMAEDAKLGGLYGKQLTFNISHPYLTPYANLFPENCEIKVSWLLDSVEKVLFDGMIVKEEVDKLFYSHNITCYDNVLNWKSYKERGKREGYIGDVALPLEEIVKDEWSYYVENTYLPEGTYKGDWDKYMFGNKPKGARPAAASGGVYSGDIISYKNATYGDKVEYYQYIFNDDYRSGSSYVSRTTSFDGKSYTGAALKEYIKYMSPLTILSKTNGSRVIQKLWTFKGNWKSGESYSSGDIVQVGTQKEFVYFYKYLLTSNPTTFHRKERVGDLGWILQDIDPSFILNNCFDGDKIVRDVNAYYNETEIRSKPWDPPEYYVGQWTSSLLPWKNYIVKYQGKLYKYTMPFEESEDSVYDNNVYMSKPESECRVYSYNGQSTCVIGGATHKITSWWLFEVLKGETPEQILQRQGNGNNYIELLDDSYLWVNPYVFKRNGYREYNNKLYKYLPSTRYEDDDYLDIGGTSISRSSSIFKGANPADLAVNGTTGVVEQFNDEIPFVINKYNNFGEWSNSYLYSKGSIVLYNGKYYKYKDDLSVIQSYQVKGMTPDDILADENYKGYVSIVTPSDVDLYEYPVITLQYALESLLKRLSIPYILPTNGFVNGDMNVFYKGVNGVALGEILKSFCALNGVYLMSDSSNNLVFKSFWLGGEQGITKGSTTFYWDSPDIVDVTQFVDFTNIKISKEVERVISDISVTYNNETVTALGDDTAEVVKLSGLFADFVVGDWNKHHFIANNNALVYLKRIADADGFHICYKASCNSRVFIPEEVGEIVFGYDCSTNGHITVIMMMHVAQNNLSGGNLSSSAIKSF